MIFKPPLPRLRRSHPLTNGLVFATPFYEGSGGILHDISGNDNNGTLTNMTPNTDWVGSQNGWALDFDGSDDYVTSPFTPSLNVGNRLTIICGFYTGSTSRQTLVSRTNAAGAWQLELSGGSARDVRTIINGAVIAATNGSVFSLNSWVNVAYVRSGTGANHAFYINAVPLSLLSSSATNYTDGSNPLEIGRRAAASQQFQGLIGRVLLYNRPLSASEITWLYFNPAIIYEPPKKYWLFGAASPQTLSPDPADYDWTAVDPALTPGAVTLTPDPADYDWTANDATLTPGSVTLSPSPAVFTWTANNPTITAGSVTLSPDAAEFEWVANDAGISVSTEITLYPEPAIWQWYAQSPSIEAQECEPLLGCRQSFFTYSIAAGIQPPPGDDCEVVSGCKLSMFTYQIER